MQINLKEAISLSIMTLVKLHWKKKLLEGMKHLRGGGGGGRRDYLVQEKCGGRSVKI